MKCSAENCTAKVKARGLCGMHYKRLMKWGDLNFVAKATSTQAEAALILGTEALTDECLLWPYGRTQGGYGVISRDGATYLVHRLICQATHGPPPTPKHEAAHSCGNGHLGCYNKHHLRWATRKENAEDMIRHGRSDLGKEKLSSRGVRNCNVKLTEEDVRCIRSLPRHISISQVARQYGVHRSTIVRVRDYTNWG